MAKEYIEREAALSAQNKSMNLAECRTRLERLPAADVVEVVKCRDCVYWRGEDDVCRGIYIDFGADGFCSGGKRKDGGQDE